MEIAARTAGADDLDVVTALSRAGTAELRPHRGGEIWSQWEARPEPVDAALAELLAGDDASILVGTIDGVVVGYAVVTIQRLHDGRLIGHLTDLYVMPDARGVGVGEALMERTTDWCRDHDCVGIDSVALPGDRATKNFFETFGLVARALRVHRAL
ncbi:MAG: GNAT family N-acetyltransferase [Acidimicrobiales bacterium]